MADKQTPTNDPDQPAIYPIRLQWHWGEQWAIWFGELTITLDEDGNTRITALMVEQAALYGSLCKLRVYEPLLSVVRLERD